MWKVNSDVSDINVSSANSDSDFSDTDKENTILSKVKQQNAGQLCNMFARMHVNRPKKAINTNNRPLQRKQPFIFYYVEDILQFNRDSLPANNKLRTVGTVTQEDLNDWCLLDLSVEMRLKLNFQSLESVPRMNTIIEIFGSIELQKVNRTTCVPVFVVHIWKYKLGDVAKYAIYLDRAKEFAHSEDRILTTDNYGSNCTYLETSVDDNNLYFDEINESMLNKAVENAENIVKNS